MKEKIYRIRFVELGDGKIFSSKAEDYAKELLIKQKPNRKKK